MPISTRSSKKNSKADSPAKKGSSPVKGQKSSPGKKSSSKNQSPSKNIVDRNGSPLRGKDKGDAIEEALANVPEAILSLLERLKVSSMEKMRKASLPDLLDRALEACSGKAIEGDIVKAWIRCLHARAQDPNTQWPSWQDWLESKVQARETGGVKNKSLDLGEAARLIITRRELVKQRQTLKKSALPRSKLITFNDLKVAKAKLTHLPTGRALKDKVKPEVLSEALGKLKRARSDLA